MAFCLLSVIRKQWVKQYNYYVDQSELPDKFYVISMEFLSLSRRRFSWQNVLGGEEQREMAVFAGKFVCRFGDYESEIVNT